MANRCSGQMPVVSRRKYAVYTVQPEPRSGTAERRPIRALSYHAETLPSPPSTLLRLVHCLLPPPPPFVGVVVVFAFVFFVRLAVVSLRFSFYLSRRGRLDPRAAGQTHSASIYSRMPRSNELQTTVRSRVDLPPRVERQTDPHNLTKGRRPLAPPRKFASV